MIHFSVLSSAQLPLSQQAPYERLLPSNMEQKAYQTSRPSLHGARDVSECPKDGKTETIAESFWRMISFPPSIGMETVRFLYDPIRPKKCLCYRLINCSDEYISMFYSIIKAILRITISLLGPLTVNVLCLSNDFNRAISEYEKTDKAGGLTPCGKCYGEALHS